MAFKAERRACCLPEQQSPTIEKVSSTAMPPSTPPAAAAAVLLVGAHAPSLERKQSLLESSGFAVTLAENICYAELFAQERHFDAAVCDESLPPHERISLARVLRIRWPWMRLVACGDASENDLFDAAEPSEADLPEILRAVLA
jgi:CheY-like chemotaxis protein